ncbi:MAG: DUF4826 family protein [Polaromonas sp.]|uniref:DUF4826 family protein n=1 Tax=Polaromonas sp. TaxID=1869339 RepID=UPI003262EDDF
MPDYDDPEIEAQWFSERREEISGYLKREGVMHGDIEAEPAWYVAPYVSVWAVKGLASPASVEWWAISGDMPNDYVSASKAQSPREAVQLIASLWQEAARYMSRGERHPTFVIGSGDRNEELGPLLASRAGLLLDWANDPEAWE